MAFIPPVDATTQELLNWQAQTTGGLTKQQCLQILAGGNAALASNPETGQDAANNYAGTTGKSIADALKSKAGTNDPNVTKQKALLNLF